MSRPLERCCECDTPTGRAGKGEDSLYTDSGEGPFCEDCFPASAIEAEVLQAQEPVAWFVFADNNGPVPLELWGFDLKACKNAVLENARSVGWKGTVEGYLFQKSWTIRPLVFAAPQPPAPCPRCTARVADLFNEQHKVDALLAENDKLQAKVAEQAERIATLESDNKGAWATADRHMTERSEARERVEEQAALIEKCEKDAARYRWLRSRDLDSIVDGGVFAGMVPDNVVLNGDDLDAAIDAHRRQSC
jgi:hypothetical protein